jgi:tRNA(Ile)-lysidine synthase TilS/MesJ
MNLQQIMSPIRRAIDDYNMIQDGDKIGVGLSGGKDSITLLAGLAGLRRFYPKKFDIVAIRVDTGLDFDKQELENLENFVKELGAPYIVEKTEIAEVVFNVRKESNPCSLCANMRRGALNSAVKNAGCNKVALGHHADDLIETFFLSMMYEGRLSTFHPVTTMSRMDLAVIRPMIYMRERDVASFAKGKPILHNPCPADKHTKREYVKDLLKEIRKEIPFVNDNVLNALTHPERTNLFEKPPKNEKGIDN